MVYNIVWLLLLSFIHWNLLSNEAAARPNARGHGPDQWFVYDLPGSLWGGWKSFGPCPMAKIWFAGSMVLAERSASLHASMGPQGAPGWSFEHEDSYLTAKSAAMKSFVLVMWFPKVWLQHCLVRQVPPAAQVNPKSKKFKDVKTPLQSGPVVKNSYGTVRQRLSKDNWFYHDVLHSSCHVICTHGHHYGQSALAEDASLQRPKPIASTSVSEQPRTVSCLTIIPDTCVSCVSVQDVATQIRWWDFYKLKCREDHLQPGVYLNPGFAEWISGQ